MTTGDGDQLRRRSDDSSVVRLEKKLDGHIVTTSAQTAENVAARAALNMRLDVLDERQNERHQETKATILELRGRLDGLMWRALSWQGAVIMALLGVMIYLVVNGVPWEPRH